MIMAIDRTALAREALDASLDFRGRAGCDLGTPINVFDLCAALTPQVRVLFTDYSMEGCYLRSDRPLIKVSALRPIGRRAFNCAHELGHHAFGHGSRIDELQADDEQGTSNDPEEFLANAFAGFLLMPKIAVRGAFTRRGWKAVDAQAPQVFTVACHFGVGYETLVSHLAYGLQEIPRAGGGAAKGSATSHSARACGIDRGRTSVRRGPPFWITVRRYRGWHAFTAAGRERIGTD